MARSVPVDPPVAAPVSSPSPALSLAEQILAADDLRRECVHDPEAGRTLPGWEKIPHKLYAATLWADELDEIYAEQAERLEKGGKAAARRGFRARFVAAALRDEAGNRVFTMEQAAALGRKIGSAVGQVYDVVCRLNGLTKEDAEAGPKN
mgnify:CR=1 FL=1